MSNKNLLILFYYIKYLENILKLEGYDLRDIHIKFFSDNEGYIDEIKRMFE